VPFVGRAASTRTSHLLRTPKGKLRLASAGQTASGPLDGRDVRPDRVVLDHSIRRHELPNRGIDVSSRQTGDGPPCLMGLDCARIAGGPLPSPSFPLRRRWWNLSGCPCRQPPLAAPRRIRPRTSMPVPGSELGRLHGDSPSVRVRVATVFEGSGAPLGVKSLDRASDSSGSLGRETSSDLRFCGAPGRTRTSDTRFRKRRSPLAPLRHSRRIAQTALWLQR
jgi:hypothetical protein